MSVTKVDEFFEKAVTAIMAEVDRLAAESVDEGLTKEEWAQVLEQVIEECQTRMD